MDLLTQAAQSVFNSDAEEELYLQLTPTKGIPLSSAKDGRTVFSEIRNTINISPEKFCNSPLQALFNAPTLGTPKTKSRNLISVNSNGFRKVGCGSGGKSFSSPTTRSDFGTPKHNGIPPGSTNSGGLGKSPLTPMTNLKLLTRIASMEESLSTSTKKALFGKKNSDENSALPKSVFVNASSTTGVTFRRHNSECLGQSQKRISREPTRTLRKHPTSDNYPVPSSPGNLVLEGLGRIPSVDDTTSSRPLEVSRKDKSLGLLSEKFLELFPLEVSYMETPRRLVIDEVAALLRTERRRVYDIINVLESLNMANRVQKNMYQWTGKLQLEETLGRLKALGEKYDIATQLQNLKNEGKKDFKVPQQMKLTRIGEGEKTDSRKEKSLSILCQKFLMILLVSPQPHMISLDNAIRLLVGEEGDGGERLRARGRRLYDIANVLTSLGLVRRIPAAKAFQYVGPDVQPVVNDDDTFGILQRHSLLPSRNVNHNCKENLITYGDHEVTPSEVAPPVQKRGRPRKLATAFTSSTLPAPKRSRLQRTRSEDVISSQSRKMTRNPSLHDICQVAEVEREKLIKEQSYRSHSSDGFESGCSRGKKFSLDKCVMLPNSDFRPISSAPSPSASLLHHRLTKRARIPVAITFQGSEECKSNGERYSRSHFIQDAKENVNSLSYKILDNQNSSAVACHFPKPLRGVMGNKLLQEMKNVSTSIDKSMQNNRQSLSTSQPFSVIRPVCDQNYKKQVHQNKEPVIIVKGSAIGNKSFSQSRVIPVSSSVSQGAQVIKVITKTTSSKQQDASTVMTVLPANPSVKAVSMKPKQLIGNGSGSFQKISEGTYTNGQRITISSSSCVVSNSSSVQGDGTEVKPSSSFVVFTVSDNQAGQRTLSKIADRDCFPVAFQQPHAVQQLGSVKVAEHVSSSICSLTSAPLIHERSFDQPSSFNTGYNHQQLTATSISKNNPTANSGTWHPSPDGSSTDSELEQIFGDTFNFSRPKALILANSSKNKNSDAKS